MSKNVEYKELASAPMNEQRNVVISECSKGGYTLAQQVVVEEGKRKINVFMKNAIQIESNEALYNLRDALNIAIEKIENEKK